MLWSGGDATRSASSGSTGATSTSYIVDVGSTMALHTGAAPRALLAFAPPDVVDAALDGPLGA